MKFYYCYHTTYHNGTRIGCIVGKKLTNEEPKAETMQITWDNLNEMYHRFSAWCEFNVWSLKKGRKVSFLTNTFFPKGDERDVKEWKTADLGIVLKITYKEFSPSVSEVLKWHDADAAMAYLRERGWER